MKYLRKYNEELKADTYKSAADKLAKMGHVKRPEELMKWHVVAQEKEKEEVKRKAIEEASKLGTYKITINDRNGKFTGDFYIYFYWNDDLFYENYEDWKRFDATSIWLQFDFAVLPASDESKEFVDNVLSKKISINSDGKCYLGSFGLNLTQGGASYDENDKPTYVLKPNGTLFYFEEYTDSIGWYMADRSNAQKFKKMIYDIFEGNIVWRETPEIPGGVKEQILDFLCLEKTHTLEEFEAFIESLKRIRVNQIYKD